MEISKFRRNFDKTHDLLNIYHEEQNKLYSIKDSNERMKLQLNHLFNNMFPLYETCCLTLRFQLLGSCTLQSKS